MHIARRSRSLGIIIITRNVYLIQRDLLIFTYLLTPAHSLHLHILYTCTVSMPTQCQYHTVSMPTQCQCHTVSMPTQCQCHTVSMPTQCRCGVYTLLLSADYAYRSLMPTDHSIADQNKHA